MIINKKRKLEINNKTIDHKLKLSSSNLIQRFHKQVIYPYFYCEINNFLISQLAKIKNF